MNTLTVILYREGNQICALYGADLIEGVAGFGNTTASALKDLARQLEEDGVVETLDSCL